MAKCKTAVISIVDGDTAVLHKAGWVIKAIDMKLTTDMLNVH